MFRDRGCSRQSAERRRDHPRSPHLTRHPADCQKLAFRVPIEGADFASLMPRGEFKFAFYQLQSPMP